MNQIVTNEAPTTEANQSNAAPPAFLPQPPRLSAANGPYQALQVVYVAAPVLAGLDKFTNLMTDWEKYLDPRIPKLLRLSPSTFMRLAGIIEVAAGIGVAVNPKLFGRVVSAWLFGIVGNLLMKRDYYDIALRDFGLAIGAFSMSQLARGAEIPRQEIRIATRQAA
jgi:hypothetical protein